MDVGSIPTASTISTTNMKKLLPLLCCLSACHTSKELPPLPPKLESHPVHASDRLNLVSEPPIKTVTLMWDYYTNDTLVVESSSDLVVWQEIWTNTEPKTNVFVYTNTPKYEFFRLKVR